MREDKTMLKRFNVKNFMSFYEREDGKSEEFSMIPGKVRNKPDHVIVDGDLKLLKFAAIYGANASGKSNFVKALDCMRWIVATGTTKGFTNKYCRISEKNQDIPSYFEVEVVIDNRTYSYGFEVILRDSKFVSEWLYELQPDGSDILIFERDVLQKTIRTNEEWQRDEKLKQHLTVYTGDIETNDRSMFLTYMNRDKTSFYSLFPETKAILKVYNWFSSTLNITFPSNAVGYSYFVNSDDLSKASDIISAFGTGIFKCVPTELSMEEFYKKIPNGLENKIIEDIEDAKLRVSSNKVKINFIATISGDLYMVSISKKHGIVCNKISFYHSEDGQPYSFGEESDGTQRLWELMDLLLSDENETFVIDEIDRCLHPSMTYRFVDTFFKFADKTKKQLIVTTHESRLMDFDLLRRDEIWFTNKRKSGETDMYSLEEFNTRFDQKIDKAYLEGRYGGVPVFTSVFPIEEDK